MVSDETPGTEQQPKKPRKPLVRLSDAQWAAARHQYEHQELPTLPAIAKAYNAALVTVEKRAAREGWLKGAKVAGNALTKIRDATNTALEQAGKQIATRVAEQYERDMQPFFEREKRAHIKDIIRRAKTRQKLTDKIVRREKKISAKDMAFIARTDDTYDQIKRRNLGMSDGIGVGGALNLSILTNQAAVQVVSK